MLALRLVVDWPACYEYFRWQPNTYEIIAFHLWLYAKLCSVPYKFEIWDELQAWNREQQEMPLPEVCDRAADSALNG